MATVDFVHPSAALMSHSELLLRKSPTAQASAALLPDRINGGTREVAHLSTPAGVTSASCLISRGTSRGAAATTTATTPPSQQQQRSSSGQSLSESSPRPVAFLEQLYQRTERGSCLLRSASRRTFLKPSPEAVDAYDASVVQAVRSGDLTVLRSMLQRGVSFDASNRFGESIVHMACRRGDPRVVRFLVEEAHVQLEVRDDFGRTPLHDACWTVKPNFDVMDVLLRAAPSYLLLAEDIRGHTPFHYARKEHLDAWVKFLAERCDLLERKLQPLPEPSLPAVAAISTQS